MAKQPHAQSHGGPPGLGPTGSLEGGRDGPRFPSSPSGPPEAGEVSVTRFLSSSPERGACVLLATGADSAC